jgi:uncharacterized protein (TIGR02678 family)
VSVARVAAQLDPATELADFQSAARALITHGLVTQRYPHAGTLALVRRFEEPLRNEFNRMCRWRLDIGPTCARLLRRPAMLSSRRPARTATQSRRAFRPETYSFLCLVLASLEGLGPQTTISQLADEAARLRAGDDALPFDLTSHAHRRAFVDAVAWLDHLGVLTLIDGDAEKFVAAGGDALYDVDGDAAGRLLVSPPSVLAGLSSPDEFLDEAYPPTPEGAQSKARHLVHRRLLTQAALYYDDLLEAERDYARQRRSRTAEELERLTGCPLECRAEGQALIGLPAAEPFPAGGAVAQAALLLGSELASCAGTAGGESMGRVVSDKDLALAWQRVVAAYAGRFTAEYRAEPDRLKAEAIGLLERLGLVVTSAQADGGVTVYAALARYRATAPLPGVLDV